jgi:glycosyltransferase involved in cell wall biosynthesis
MCALAALRLIRAHEPRAVLVFPGTVHPNPKIGEAASLAREIRETVATDPELRANVFFHGWVDYEDWGSILAESAVALSLHHDSLETRLAFRSRVLEYIWAGLPVVATGGDVLAEIISRRDLGQVVPAGAPEAVARAVLSLLREPVERRSEAFAAARGELIWEKNLRPLIRFCENPRPAADRAGGQVMPPPAETIQSLRARISALEADKQGDERGVTAPGGKEAKRKPGRWWRGIFGG